MCHVICGLVLCLMMWLMLRFQSVSNQIDAALGYLVITSCTEFVCHAYSYVKMLSVYECSGPSRFDWDASTNSWIYKRTGANLVQLLEKEISELCGTPAELS